MSTLIAILTEGYRWHQGGFVQASAKIFEAIQAILLKSDNKVAFMNDLTNEKYNFI